MTIIEAIRERMPECSDISDDELLRATEGTFLRACAEMTVSLHAAKQEIARQTIVRKILAWMKRVLS